MYRLCPNYDPLQAEADFAHAVSALCASLPACLMDVSMSIMTFHLVAGLHLHWTDGQSHFQVMEEHCRKYEVGPVGLSAMLLSCVALLATFECSFMNSKIGL